jgi:hypothetical protein
MVSPLTKTPCTKMSFWPRQHWRRITEIKRWPVLCRKAIKVAACQRGGAVGGGEKSYQL